MLISGSGSNLQALIDARDEERIDIDIVSVISNQAGARGLARADSAGIPTRILEHRGFADRTKFDHALGELIGAVNPHLVILAGFMRIIGCGVLDPFRGRMINLHPSLLPLYRGTDTYQRALDAGDREHGASIHFVTGELDGGPVISQVRVPVLAGDDKHRLAARLAPMEHRLLVSTIELFTRHKVESGDGGVFVDGSKLQQPLQLHDDALYDALR
ncbi:MAG: phosphoribosylglycinamide formyltransferase [Xanthomonadales bacterium]